MGLPIYGRLQVEGVFDAVPAAWPGQLSPGPFENYQYSGSIYSDYSYWWPH